MKLSDLIKQERFRSTSQEAMLNVLVTSSWILGELAAAVEYSSGVRKTATAVGAMIDTLESAIETLITQNKHREDDLEANARHMKNNVIPAMNAVRHAADDLERAVPHGRRPLPGSPAPACLRPPAFALDDQGADALRSPTPARGWPA